MSGGDPLLHALFSCPSTWCVSPPHGRKSNRPSGGEVSKTTEGLRMLAAEGSWFEVLDLASQLERELIRAAPTRRSDSSPLKQAAATTIEYDSAILQLVLARVTAYAKMSDYGRAVQVLENLPWEFIKEEEIPFSLVFLRAFLPMMISNVSPQQVTATQSQLYQMLAKVDLEIASQEAEEEQEREANTKRLTKKGETAAVDTTQTPHQQPRTNNNVTINTTPQQQTKKYVDDSVPYALLEHRRFRISRAIFLSHTKLQEHVSAIALLQTMADSHAARRERLLAEENKAASLFERIFITSPVVTRASGYYSSPLSSSSFSPSQNSSSQSKQLQHVKQQDAEIQKLADVATMEQMICLQQAMCLALYSGNAPLSHQLRKTIETIPTPIKESDPSYLKDLMMCHNDSLLDVFFDRPGDAAARLSAAVGLFLIDPSVVLPQMSAATATGSSKLAPNIIKPKPTNNNNVEGGGSASSPSSSTTVGSLNVTLPFYLESSRSLHVHYQYLSLCLSLITLVPHALHAPPSAQSQRAPASAESKRPQTAPDTAALCNAALDRLVTCYPSIALRMPGLTTLVGEVRSAMTAEGATNRKNVYQTVLSYLVAGRECNSALC